MRTNRPRLAGRRERTGRVWRFARRGFAAETAPVHVTLEMVGQDARVGVVFEEQGRPVLRRDGPGLPAERAETGVAVAEMVPVPEWVCDTERMLERGRRSHFCSLPRGTHELASSDTA